MKKIMILAMMMVASATAFAGDSDGLKAIMKAKTYDDANQLLKQNLASLADNAEKAKAYNKLVDLAMTKYNAESTIQTENQVNKQMGKEEKPGMFSFLPVSCPCRLYSTICPSASLLTKSVCVCGR